MTNYHIYEYIKILNTHKIESLISNVSTSFMVQQYDDDLIAYTVNDAEWDSCYVCSPYNALFTYGLEEIGKLKNRPLESLLIALTKFIGFIARCCKANKNIHVNNLLLSTNLYYNAITQNIPLISKYSLAHYPEHAILFRSLNDYNSNELIAIMKAQGYRLVPSRVVYFFDCRDDKLFRKKNIKIDLLLLKRTKYKLVDNDEVTASDYPKIVELYNQLYLDKYSLHNPQFTTSFMEHCHKANFLYFKGFRDTETQELIAILGFYTVDNVMTTPVFGYDTNIDSKEGLYRLITIALLLEGKKRQAIIHASSGAGKFKRSRGANACNEYTAIYHKHLPWYRKLFWLVIEKLLVNIALPIIKKYEL